MPGILPMKVIKIGSAAQSRVAQACDRCRSKKIRCDGITPCCSQCANVGFECKTSDKLSRRAFPRGYTESLEERVRSLESEVRELKDLLDTKDDKIDMLSRLHSNSPFPQRASSDSSRISSTASSTRPSQIQSEKDRTAEVTADFTDDESQGITIPCSAAASSGKTLVDSFRSELKAKDPHAPILKPQIFFNSRANHARTSQSHDSNAAGPSRMASDQMINMFIQEWLPMFPILHRSKVLQLYSTYVADPDSIQSDHEAAQLHLLFGISALSAEWEIHDHGLFEHKWQPAIDLVAKQISIASLQSVLMAMLYYVLKQDHERLRKYKAISAKLTKRLGLHQSQKRSSLGPLATETRKRLLWISFTLDCFSSAILGQPRALCDLDLACELPSDVDDENITDDSFLTGTPGESTRISNAIALFRGARVLAEILDTVYSSAPSHEVSLHAITSLCERVDLWSSDLSPHLHLRFLQDKPSSALVGSRAPFLSLMHHYMRTLLYRPLFLAENQTCPPAVLISLAQSSKHIVQIIQLLEERRLCFSFGLNKEHLLIMAGFGLLYPVLRTDRTSNFAQDSQKHLQTACSSMERVDMPGHLEFRDLVNFVLPLPLAIGQKGARPVEVPSSGYVHPLSRNQFNMIQQQQSLRPSHTRSKSAKTTRVKIEPVDEPYVIRNPITSHQYSQGAGLTLKNDSKASASGMSANAQRPYSFPVSTDHPCSDSTGLPNLDYLDFNCDSPMSYGNADANGLMDLSVSPVNQLQYPENMPTSSAFPYLTNSASSDSFAWSSDSWTPSSTFDRPNPSSVLSFSDESLTSAEDMSTLLPPEFLTTTV